MRRTALALGLLLGFSLGCASLTGGNEAPPPPAPATTPVPGTDAADSDATPAATSGTDAAEQGGDCCCEYTEQGATAKSFATMARANCEAWAFQCVDDAKCATQVAPEPAPAPAPVQVVRPKPRPMTRPTPKPTTMTRPGSTNKPGTTEPMPKPTTMTRPR